MIAALLPMLGRNWKAVLGGGIILILTVALFIANGNARHWQKLDALHTAQRDTEITKNAVNLASIATLTKALADKNAESDARAKAYADAKAADARAVADMNKRYATTAGRVASLEAISRVPGGSEQCKVPHAVSDALSGL